MRSEPPWRVEIPSMVSLGMCWSMIIFDGCWWFWWFMMFGV
jgi:hypothetical protein